MNNKQIYFEFLPYEILIEIFEYLDTCDIYRAFYNLNFRFNQILQSLNQLHLTINSNENINLSYRIHTLYVKQNGLIKLNNFLNLRKLILYHYPCNISDKFETNYFPYLEYISIQSTDSYYLYSMNNLYKLLFSNHFSQLKFCSLPQTIKIQKTTNWSQTLSLRYLKVGKIGFFVYLAILAACPNLHFLNFIEDRSFGMSFDIPYFVNHVHLKRLSIKEKHFGSVAYPGALNQYLSYVPNLEELRIYVLDYYMGNFEYLLKSDWLASAIDWHLPLLEKFRFYLPDFNDKIISDQLEESFIRKHKNRYKSQLIIYQKMLE